MAELVSIKRNVDVSPGQAAPAVFHCSQGDVGSKIILGLLNNGTAYTIPSGVTVTIEGSESNGSIFTPISATASGSDITFYLTGEMTAVAGPAICQAVLKSGSNILGTANFTLEVESSPMGADAPPVFTDAGWTWMLNKLTTEFVPALGDNIIDAIDSKADQSDLTALSNTVVGHTGSITVLNNAVNALNQSVSENRQNIATKLDKNQGTANAGKYLKVQPNGQVVPVDLIDNSLLVETMAADSKATGDALKTKLNKNQGANNSGKYLKVGEDGNVETAATDTTLSVSGDAADAKAVGDELDDLKADLKRVVCNNLMGNEANVLYPVNIPPGSYFTVSTSNGSIFPTDSTLQVQLLKENKTQSDYFSIKNGATSQTIRTSTSKPTTYYLRFSEVPSVPLMVNYGRAPLTYQEYFPDIQKNVEQKNETVAGLLEGGKLADILAVQNSVKVSRPRIINGSLSTTTGERVYILSQVNSYCITPDLLHVAKGSVITKSAQTTMRIYEYSKDDAFISYSTIQPKTTKYTFSADKYVRLFFLVSDGTNVKTVFDNVIFDLILLNYEKPGVISTFMGLTGNGGTFEQYVESGEACIIQFPNSEVMEIDFHKDAPSNNYRYYRDSLMLRGVRRLDYIVITHYHDDHVGLFEKALKYEYIKIDGAKAYLPQYITSELAEARGWETYKERQDTIIQTLQEHNCTIVYPVDGDVLKIDDAVITWYNCDHSIYSDTSGDYYSTNYNDWSLCFNFRYENTIVNYTADLGPIGQRAMAGKMPKASILKAMHHGWDNGVNNLIPAFINNVSPDMVISCNGYEHRPIVSNQQEPNMLNASSPIYTWAEANGVPAYPTCTNGNIDILINKYGYRLDGHYTRYIRNDKNWSYSDNSEHIES